MRPAGEGLRKIVLEALRQAPPEETPLVAWPLVCGATVAGRTRAVEFAAGVLRIEVPDAAWREELAALIADYLARFAQVPGAAVERIEFVVARR